MTLYELNNIVAGALGEMFPEELWVEGELLEGRHGGGGHFYGELIERRGDNITARARITIWARTYNILALRFREETGQNLRAGINVKMLVKVGFHEAYGYSLNVLDIDSTFTLGDQARRRQEILKQLEEDGIINDNKELPLPRLLQRVAIISSPTAAGLGDFMRQLHENDYGLKFHTQLYPAIMQGQQTPESIIEAMEGPLTEVPDVIVIIRGGGATADLSDFDDYALASCIAQCPVPVFVGIGHDRDETVLDHVAHTSFKTPTAVAAFLVEHQASELALLQEMELALPHKVNERLQREHHRLELLSVSMPATARMFLQRQHHRVEMMEMRLRGLDPELQLQRGYSITMANGKILKSTSDVMEGEVIVTKLADGEIFSKVVI